MTDRSRIAVALALVFALSACTGGTPAASEPDESEDVATMEPAPTTEVVTPSPLPVETAPAEVDSGNGRPASITLELSGTTTQADGSYTSSGVARLCGNAVMNLTGNVREFSFEFPNDSDDHQIGDVTFSAQDLLPGATTTSFHIGVSVTTADGHEPPATVVDTEQAGSDDTGSAQRSKIGGTTTLTLDASDEIGQTIHLTATCGPRAG